MNRSGNFVKILFANWRIQVILELQRFRKLQGLSRFIFQLGIKHSILLYKAAKEEEKMMEEVRNSLITFYYFVE
jgi:hypothetical protein